MPTRTVTTTKGPATIAGDACLKATTGIHGATVGSVCRCCGLMVTTATSGNPPYLPNS